MAMRPLTSWTMGIPLPFHTTRWLFLPAYQCVACGTKFKSTDTYYAHYIAEHTDGEENIYTPTVRAEE